MEFRIYNGHAHAKGRIRLGLNSVDKVAKVKKPDACNTASVCTQLVIAAFDITEIFVPSK